MPLAPVLTKRWAEPRSWTLETYERTDGYRALRKALSMQPDEVTAVVKDSALRGRGGAGFGAGQKWGFIPQGDDKPRYVVVNADEGEPGTCRDAPLMMADPHSLIEGTIIASYAIGCNPGQYEARMGTTLRKLLELAGCIRNGHELKFWTPGGSSTPMFTKEHIDVPLDFDSVLAAGSMNGTSALMIFDDSDCVVRAVKK